MWYYQIWLFEGLYVCKWLNEYKYLGTHIWDLSPHDCGGTCIWVTTAYFINLTSDCSYAHYKFHLPDRILDVLINEGPPLCHKNPEGEFPAIILQPQIEMSFGYLTGQWSEMNQSIFEWFKIQSLAPIALLYYDKKIVIIKTPPVRLN